MRKILGALAFLFAINANAIVDMKNANYSNTWVDIIVPGSGYDLRVARTYNSRSLFSGIFGYGWCSDFETSISVTPEGNIRLTECGAGAEIIYLPRDFNKKDIDKTVAQIITKMKATKSGQTEEYYKNLATSLAEDTESRSDFAHKLGISIPVKEGTAFFANGREVESFVFNKTYYTRNLADGSSQRFDPQGRMIAQYDKNGNYLKFEYDKNILKEVVDNNGRKLSFKYYTNNKVKDIAGPNGLTAEYKFANLDDLSNVKNGWKNTYTYAYDDLHNLTKATYPDGTFIALTYDKIRDWVTGFTDRQKCNEVYEYESAKQDPKNHYWSTVKKTCGKEVVSNNRYEFWYKNRFDNQPYLSRVLTNVNGNVTDISYHEVFGKPVSIRKNNDRITYTYFANGLVKTKETGLFKMDFDYDTKTKKVSKVSTDFFNEKGKKVSKKMTEFKYDNKGNLSFAQNSDGQKVSLTYDNKGRIASIADQAKKVVQIQYEERFGKPAIVTRPGLGTIRVSYKPNGEINKVESKEGPTVAVQVASTFNNLLDIISPATNEIYL